MGIRTLKVHSHKTKTCTPASSRRQKLHSFWSTFVTSLDTPVAFSQSPANPSQNDEDDRTYVEFMSGNIADKSQKNNVRGKTALTQCMIRSRGGGRGCRLPTWWRCRANGHVPEPPRAQRSARFCHHHSVSVVEVWGGRRWWWREGEKGREGWCGAGRSGRGGRGGMGWVWRGRSSSRRGREWGGEEGGSGEEGQSKK